MTKTPIVKQNSTRFSERLRQKPKFSSLENFKATKKSNKKSGIKSKKRDITKISKMDSKQQIQQQIASFVPEFSGEESDSTKVVDTLTKFIGTADTLYNQLETDEDREYFGGIIKYRLTGTAFRTIDRQKITEYPKIKTMLINIYEPVVSLNELENNCTKIKQQYGETVRKYGYRLTEALEQYKTGLKTKYKIAKLELTHEKHIDTKSLETFKKGLINNVLKEKVATSTAKTIEEMINETEKIEAMLSMVTTVELSQQPTPQPQNDPNQQILDLIKQLQQSTTQKISRNPNPIICNYCRKPNHTYDVCRTRIFTEQSRRQTHNQYNQINPQRQYTFRGYNPQNQSQTPNYTNRMTQAEQQNFLPNYQPPVQTNYGKLSNSNNPSNKYLPQMQGQNFNTYQQPRYSVQPQERPIKYCSFCKTTKGHTFEECRNKLFPRNQAPHNDHPSYNHRPQNTGIEDTLRKMKINTIIPQMQETVVQPGNSTGSNQE